MQSTTSEFESIPKTNDLLKLKLNESKIENKSSS